MKWILVLVLGLFLMGCGNKTIDPWIHSTLEGCYFAGGGSTLQIEDLKSKEGKTYFDGYVFFEGNSYHLNNNNAGSFEHFSGLNDGGFVDLSATFDVLDGNKIEVVYYTSFKHVPMIMEQITF